MCRGVAQSGSAPVLGTGGREFESRRPDHRNIGCTISKQDNLWKLTSLNIGLMPIFAVYSCLLETLLEVKALTPQCLTLLLFWQWMRLDR